MKILVHSFLLVFASEWGDKTQLLALVLATRFRRPWVIMAGILTATLLNHGLASWLGGWISPHIPPHILVWALAAIFLAFALWILVPDKDEELKAGPQANAYLTTVVTFFLAEMGDKTQLATLALGARFANPVLVTLGTTLGMLATDGLAVFFGEKLTRRVPMLWVRRAAALLFALFALGLLVGY